MGFHTTASLRAASVALVLACAAPAGAAAPYDPLIEGARQCTQQFPVQERAQGIPTHLLAAISSTESGRWHKQLGMALPWPWTINVEGKGYYFDTKAEAVAQTAAFMRKGYRSIDVGCMQVNLKHHPKAFSDLNSAFEPATNVAYAATFLRTNYNDLGDWIKATAAYHSRTSVLGRQYLARIEKSWNSIVTKVAQARSNQGLAAQPTAQPDFDVASAPAVRARSMNGIATTRNVRVIQVSERQTRRSSDVMVVRPQTTPIRVADAGAATAPAGSDMLVTNTAPMEVKAIGVDSGAASANSAPQAAKGPRFVFAN